MAEISRRFENNNAGQRASMALEQLLKKRGALNVHRKIIPGEGYLVEADKPREKKSSLLLPF